MTSLSAADFDAFFGKLYQDGDQRPLEPFPWQRRLVRRVLGEDGRPPGWPRVLALPTASGKTAAIDVAVFTLACQADAAAGARNAPRRIFFVVDRRVIVDEAFERARALAERLQESKEGILGRVADRLRSLAGPAGRPLEVFELRGGIYRDDAWARTPLQPTVIASTVDQVGSRLLYRGYGVSPRSWPIHAGLAAHDALVILDEAHCAAPFSETLEAVASYREWAEEPLALPFHHVLMTATPRPGVGDEEVFRLEDEDREHPELGRRLRAGKPARLLPEVAGKTGSSRLVSALSEQAEAFADAGAWRIAILVNRVETARRVYDRLSDRRGDKVLMIGRMRPWDRDRLIAEWRPYLAAGPGRDDTRDRPIFVVATQCLEVGANFDFDALVTECASLDALRQRFGRLNRLGSDERALGAVAVASDDLKAGSEDFVYGEALRETWGWLMANGVEEEGGPRIDFGIDALDAVWERAESGDESLRERLSPPAPHAPVLLPAHVDLWTQTAPTPAVEPDVSLFLHGAGRGAPDVQVCWRRDLVPPADEHPEWKELLALWTNTVALLPPSSAECMSVPLYVVERWLRGVSRPAEGLTDVEGSSARREFEDEGAIDSPRRTILRWRGPEESELVGRGDRLRPGDTLVFPAEGREWETFGHLPPGFPVDVGEAGHFVRRRRATLRLHPALLEAWPESPGRARLVELAGWNPAIAEEEGLESAAAETLAGFDGESAPGAVREICRALAGGDFEALRHPSGHGWVLRGKHLVPVHPAETSGRPSISMQMAETFTSDDDSASALGGPLVPLEGHCAGVAELVEVFAEKAGLPSGLTDGLRLAGRLHDLGKADPRFQAWLHDGNALAAQLSPNLLAKSAHMPEDRRHRERARCRAGYPRGGRHELLSVRLVESAPSLLESAADSDLVLHLIASHHGRCRPLAPVIADTAPVEVHLEHEGLALASSSATGLERIDSGVAERFWRLVRQYGWWGVALLEAILRLADHRRSEAEEQALEPEAMEPSEVSA